MSAAAVRRAGTFATMQTILGYGGIGRPLATELAQYTTHVRAVSRQAKALPTDGTTRYEHLCADLLNRNAVTRAVAGSEVVYLTAGLPYRAKIWQRDWPVVVANVITALRALPRPARLVFFDNVYALDPASYPTGMREDTPYRPDSRKGAVRKQILETLTRAAKAGDFKLVVARSADFYGPGASNSLLHELVLQPLSQHKRPRWLGDPSLPHPFTYVPDAARATALLGNDPRAVGEVWNLPTAPATSLAELVALAGKNDTTVQRLPRWLYATLALVMPDLRELYELRSQIDQAYRFDSSKIEQALGLSATPLRAGLRATLGWFGEGGLA